MLLLRRCPSEKLGPTYLSATRACVRPLRRQLDVVLLQRRANRAIEHRDRLIEVGAGAELQRLRSDERGLPIEKQEDRAQAGIETSAFAVGPLLGVTASHRRRLQALIRGFDRLERVAHLRLDRLLQLQTLPRELCLLDPASREVGLGGPIADRKLHLQCTVPVG